VAGRSAREDREPSQSYSPPGLDVSGISPGSNRGDCDVPEAELVAPVAPLADPVVVADPDAVPDFKPRRRIWNAGPAFA
jgi:hypothetical protein